MRRFPHIPEPLHPNLRAFLDYWLEKCGETGIPRREDIDPADISGLLPGICLLELSYDDGKLDRVKFRLAGTDLYRMAGAEMTGRYVDEVMPAETYAQITEQFDWMIETLQPAFRRFRWHSPAQRDFAYERILVPLGKPDAKPSHFLGMHVIADDGPHVQPPPDLPVG